jgi:hypothetical protein
VQGCQIFLGATYQNVVKYAYVPENMPNGTYYTKCSNNIITNGHTIFHSKAFQNASEFGFLV